MDWTQRLQKQIKEGSLDFTGADIRDFIYEVIEETKKDLENKVRGLEIVETNTGQPEAISKWDVIEILGGEIDIR